MKYLAILVLLFLVSCKDDEPTPTPTPQLLEGGKVTYWSSGNPTSFSFKTADYIYDRVTQKIKGEYYTEKDSLKRSSLNIEVSNIDLESASLPVQAKPSAASGAKIWIIMTAPKKSSGISGAYVLSSSNGTAMLNSRTGNRLKGTFKGTLGKWVQEQGITPSIIVDSATFDLPYNVK